PVSSETIEGRLAEDCAVLSSKTSPALATLAASGVVFDDNTAQSSASLPSMVSLLTGRAMLCDAQRVPAGVSTLAERLAAAGYQTVAFAGNPLVSRAAGF